MTTRKETKKTKIQSVSTEKPSRTFFPIVGLGASAGGLEAYKQFFRKVPPDSGLAFVLVLHLDPDHASMLTAILQRCTAMPVVEAKDQLVVVPNTVYAIPPNRDMAIFHGILQLSVPAVPRGHRMPIDAFLCSLAEDQAEQAVGIILSGTGTDGTLGLRAIRGAGGITLVQEPTTAKYDSMPASAIKAGYATQVLPVEEMPAALLAARRTLSKLRQPRVPSKVMPVSAMNELLMLLRSATGHDFSLYKKSTIGRRIERRMVQHDIADIEVYTRYLRENQNEVRELFKDLLINVTSFFRDPEAFALLKKDIFPLISADKPEDYVFRIWVVGCATGEEAYSIAILFREFVDETNRGFTIQLYSTDLDDDAIAIARAGLYPPNIAAAVTPDRLRRFFAKEDAGYRVKKELREMVVFAIQNVIKDPPFTKLDLISCRNLMIYLEPELQNQLIPAFHYALKPGGVLFLSPSESIGNYPDLFMAMSRKWKFYRANYSSASTRVVMAGGLSWVAGRGIHGSLEGTKVIKETNFSDLTRRLLLQFYAPASVVTDACGNLLYVYGETGRYLRPAPGQVTFNVIDMAREGLQLELRAAVQLAGSQGNATLEREVLVNSHGEFRPVSFSVRPLAVPKGSQGLLLMSFQDVARPAPVKSGNRRSAVGSLETWRIKELERDLAETRENLQSIIEEQQVSNEEFKSTNEEMQSTNEELQSTNEEMETSKEELQSVNEELITVNTELQAKIEQLSGLQNDMKNLLDNINVGTIFLDQHQLIRRFTRGATRAYRLIATDVGRPLADIKSNLEDDDLIDEAQTVFESSSPSEREVRTTGGACYLARIQPYRTLDDAIEGIVLTFTDISKRVEAEAAERKARKLAESIIDTVREPLVVLNGDMRVVSASRSFYQRFHFTPGDVIDQSIYDLGNHQWNIPALRERLETVLPRDQVFEDFAVEFEIPAVGRCKMLLNARCVVVEAGERPLILLAMENVGEAPLPKS